MDKHIINPNSSFSQDTANFERDCLPTIKRCISILQNMISGAEDERLAGEWDADNFLYTLAFEGIMDAGIGEAKLRAISKLFAVLHELTLETAAGMVATASFLPPETADRFLERPSMELLKPLIDSAGRA